MKRITIYKISLTATIILSILIFICFFLNALYSFLFFIPFFFFLSAAIISYKKLKADKENKTHLDNTLSSQEHKYDIKVLENDEIRYYQSWHYVDNSEKTDEEAKVLIYKGDERFYHLFLGCFQKQPY